MGQPIRIVTTTVVGSVAMFATDRSITGQEGISFSAGDEPGPGLPARLATEIFAVDAVADNVFVAANQVAVRRAAEWDDAALDAVAGVIARFLVFYDEESG
jgi:hypothetical protein